MKSPYEELILKNAINANTPTLKSILKFVDCKDFISSLKYENIVKYALSLSKMNLDFFIALINNIHEEKIEYVMNIFNQVPNNLKCYFVVELATNSELKSSADYEFVLNETLKINDAKTFKAIADMLYCDEIVQSSELKNIITTALELKNPKLIESYANFLIRENPINHGLFLKMMGSILKIKDVELVESIFIKLNYLSYLFYYYDENFNEDDFTEMYSIITRILEVNEENILVLLNSLCLEVSNRVTPNNENNSDKSLSSYIDEKINQETLCELLGNCEHPDQAKFIVDCLPDGENINSKTTWKKITI